MFWWLLSASLVGMDMCSIMNTSAQITIQSWMITLENKRKYE